MRRWSSKCAHGHVLTNIPRTRCITRLDFRRWTSNVAKTPSIAQVLDFPARSEDPLQLNVRGFVRSIRKQKTKAFAAIDDGSSLKPLQAIVEPEQALSLSTGAAVSLRGQWIPSRNPTQQAAELKVEEVQVLGENDAESNPIQKKWQTPEFLRTIPHLRARIPHNALLLRLRSQLIASATRFFENQGFIQAHTPIITSSDCEGAGEVFEVRDQGSAKPSSPTPKEDFFGSPRYLTVSAQLHLEALAQSVGKIWTLSPTFRAEKSQTARHLSEFYMLEAEECFVDELENVMSVVEALIKEMTRTLLNSKVGKELSEWHNQNVSDTPEERVLVDIGERWRGLTTPSPWPRITYQKGVEMLQDAVSSGRVHFEHLVNFSAGLHTEHERWLAESFNSPVFVTDYPGAIKPFYMAPSKGKNRGSANTVACFDLLLPDVCEVAGGSLREHRLHVLKKFMEEQGLTRHFRWYLQLREYGSVPHGGFGLGFDRLLAYLGGVKNVRDVATFPRWHGRCSC